MESDYLLKYYKLERTHWWFTVREEILRQQLKKSLPERKNLRILNVGVATGKTSEMLLDFGNVTSVELDHDTCVFLRVNLMMEVTEASVTSLPFPNQSFDVICLFDVLEHVKSEEQAIAELNRVCKLGGLLYISCPAFSFLWSSHDRINHHYRRYTSSKLEKVIGKGFKMQYLSYFNTILFIPIAGYRIFQRLVLPKNILRSDFAESGILSRPWLGWICKKLFGMEIRILKYMKFIFGISILARAVKEENLISNNNEHL